MVINGTRIGTEQPPQPNAAEDWIERMHDRTENQR